MQFSSKVKSYLKYVEYFMFLNHQFALPLNVFNIDKKVLILNMNMKQNYEYVPKSIHN